MEGFLILFVGILCGILINYLADILPLFRKFTRPVCLHCHQPVGWGRYLFLLSCSNCGKYRRLRAIMILVIVPALVLWMWLKPPGRLGFWLGVVVMVYLWVVAVIDLEYRAILTQVSLVGGGLGIFVGLSIRGLGDTLLGGLAGGVILLSIYYLGILFVRWLSKIRHTEIQEVAFGFGDVILGAILGLMTGWPEIIGVIISAIFLAGGISALILLRGLLLKKYITGEAIPYAPFLIIGAAIFLFIPK